MPTVQPLALARTNPCAHSRPMRRPASWRGLGPEHGGDEEVMRRKFRIGDHVSWNSEAGRVSGTIIAVHTKDYHYKGHVRRASADDPQYEIKSDKTDHIAAHKGSALRLRVKER
jgi:hypothetical protein